MADRVAMVLLGIGVGFVVSAVAIVIVVTAL